MNETLQSGSTKDLMPLLQMCINEMRKKLDFVYIVTTFKITNIIVLQLSIVIFNAAIFIAILGLTIELFVFIVYV